MSTNDTINAFQDLEITSENTGMPEQLSLLAGSVPLQFRLDERTRRSGLQHVAALRQQMIAQAATRRARSTTSSTTASTRDAGSGSQIAA